MLFNGLFPNVIRQDRWWHLGPSRNTLHCAIAVSDDWILDYDTTRMQQRRGGGLQDQQYYFWHQPLHTTDQYVLRSVEVTEIQWWLDLEHTHTCFDGLMTGPVACDISPNASRNQSLTFSISEYLHQRVIGKECPLSIKIPCTIASTDTQVTMTYQGPQNNEQKYLWSSCVCIFRLVLSFVRVTLFISIKGQTQLYAHEGLSKIITDTIISDSDWVRQDNQRIWIAAQGLKLAPLDEE